MTKKYTLCPACGEPAKFSTMASDRSELEREAGETLPCNCHGCGKRYTAHVNDVKARPNSTVLYVSVVIAIICTITFWNLGFVAAASFLLPATIYGVQTKEAATFNQYLVRRTR